LLINGFFTDPTILPLATATAVAVGMGSHMV